MSHFTEWARDSGPWASHYRIIPARNSTMYWVWANDDEEKFSGEFVMAEKEGQFSHSECSINITIRVEF